MYEVTRQLRHSLKDCPIDASGVNVTRLFVMFVVFAVFVKSGRLNLFPFLHIVHLPFSINTSHSPSISFSLIQYIYFLCLLIQI